MNKAPDIRAAALHYAEQGWAVLPCHGIVNGACTCRTGKCVSPGKHPRTAHGAKDATTNEAQIASWWEQWPDSNVEIATGATSGLVVIDVDGPEGEAALRALDLNLPATLEARTGRGRHVLLSAPGGVHSKTFGPNLSLRGDGLHIIAPPSLHASGRHYRWANGLTPIAPAPAALLALLNSPSRTTPNLAVVATPSDGTISNGTRKRTLLRMAMGMRPQRR